MPGWLADRRQIRALGDSSGSASLKSASAVVDTPSSEGFTTHADSPPVELQLGPSVEAAADAKQLLDLSPLETTTNTGPILVASANSSRSCSETTTPEFDQKVSGGNTSVVPVWSCRVGACVVAVVALTNICSILQTHILLAARKHRARCLKILTAARVQIEMETKLLIDSICPAESAGNSSYDERQTQHPKRDADSPLTPSSGKKLTNSFSPPLVPSHPPSSVLYSLASFFGLFSFRFSFVPYSQQLCPLLPFFRVDTRLAFCSFYRATCYPFPVVFTFVETNKKNSIIPSFVYILCLC